MPSHYVWTPRGYIFCDGHWGYPLENRGVLFAPVYFPPSIYGRSEYYSFSPIIVVNLGVLTANLFTYPRYSHYYFGDYYDDAYLGIGIFPRIEVDQIRTWYDPTYEYDRWHNRNAPRWEENQRREYDLRHADKDLRPPRTYHEMEIRQTNKLPEQQRNNFRIAEPLTVVAASKETPIKFVHIDAKAQQKIATQATAVRKFVSERNRWESKAIQKTVQPPMKRKSPVTPPSEQKKSATPVEHKGSVTPPAAGKEQVTQPPRETKTKFVPPGEVHITKPERVKVPAPPIVGRQVAAEKSPPPQPVSELKYKGEVKKDAPKIDQRKGNTKDKSKDKSKDKGK